MDNGQKSETPELDAPSNAGATPSPERGERPNWRIVDLLDTLAARGDATALIRVVGETPETWSAAAISAHARSMGASLRAEGLQPGDHAAIYGGNGPGWVIAALGVVAAGGVLTPIDAAMSTTDAGAILTRSRVAWVFADAERASEIAEVAPESRVITLDEEMAGLAHWRSWAQRDASGFEPFDARVETPTALFHTSGTTGKPKAFYLTAANIAANVASILDWPEVGPNDVVAMPLPMHHVLPLILGTFTPLTIGTQIVLPESPTGPHILTALKLTNPSVLIGVPRLYEAILAGMENRVAGMGGVAKTIFNGLRNWAIWSKSTLGADLGSWALSPLRKRVAPRLRMLVSGGSKLDPLSIKKLEALGWDVRVGYGLAETGSVFTGQLFAKRAGTEGQPIPGGEIRIAAPNDEGVGEVELRGPMVFGGYIDNPEANAAAFTTDGYFKTGDLGRLDADRFLSITGRVKEVIVLGGGKNIYPEDVEKKYASHPYLAEIGLLERQGALAALIVPDLAAMKSAGVMDFDNAIRVALAEIGKNLPSTQRLAGFALTRDPLPRTSLTKLRRFMLPDLYERALSGRGASAERELTPEESAWLADPARSALWAHLVKSFPDQKLTPDTSPQLDLGMDSFDWMNMAAELEEELGLRLTEADIAEIATLRDLLEIAGAERDPDAAAAETAAQLDADRRRWLAPRSGFEAAASSVLFFLNGVLMRILFGLRVRGVEHLPTSGPIIICPNHMSDLDPSTVAAAVPGRLRGRLRWAAYRGRVFNSGTMRFFARAFGAFPVDERSPSGAVTLAREALEQDGVQIWFPEGWRSPDGALMAFQPGIGQLLRETDAAVAPLRIEGTFAAWPRDRRWPRFFTSVRTRFGPTVSLRDLDVAPDAPPGVVADALREKLAAFLDASRPSPDA